MTPSGNEAATERPPAERSVPRADLRNDVRTSLCWGSRIALVGLMAWVGLSFEHPAGPLVDLAIGLGLGFALLGLGSLGWSFLQWITRDWAKLLGRTVLIASIGALALLIAFSGLPPLLGLVVWGAWLAAATGLALAALLGWKLLRRAPAVAASRRSRNAHAALALATAVLAVALTLWWWWPGSADPAPPLTAGEATPLTLADPGAVGPLPVASLRYGSGLPAWRPEYGQGAALRTETIDLSDLVELGPVARPARRAALGYDLDTVPRNAVVWYPSEGDGPFPLLLIAHGNANLYVASEDGYAWLGEHLASHGLVVVSIDAAAFNALPVVGSLRGENHARALLMLAHLDLWRGWEADADPALPRVDLDRVALAGHSRGGEAAAIAAELDRIGRLPADALTPLSGRVGGPHDVRAVIAVAPSDGQYRVGDRPTTLVGVDYLVLHGGFDADVSSFVGERQFERARPAEGGFKAAVYLHHANHGQFNDAWGRYDQPRPLAPLLRTAAIMPAAEQQRAGAVLISAFLRASLLDESGYRELLRDPRRGADWLPDTAFVTRYDDGSGITLLGGDGVDPTVGSLPGSQVSAEGFALWRVDDPGFRAGVSRDATAITLGWLEDPQAAPPAYRLRLPMPLADLVTDLHETLLTLDVGRGRGPLPDGVGTPSGPLDASLVLRDEAGEVASLPLAGAQGVPPHLPTVVTRLGPFEAVRYRPDAYPLFQRVDLPLAALLATNPALDLEQVYELALVFDQVPEGVLALRSLRLTER